MCKFFNHIWSKSRNHFGAYNDYFTVQILISLLFTYWTGSSKAPEWIEPLDYFKQNLDPH